jgi:Flp pilus assembly CpaE family ATPase
VPTILLVGAKGGVGTSMLAAGLARTLARRQPVLLVDAVRVAGIADLLLDVPVAHDWSDLLRLAPELTGRHLAAVAIEAGPNLRLLAAPADCGPSMTGELLTSLAGLGGFVLVDTERSAIRPQGALAGLADHLLLVTTTAPGALRAARRLANEWPSAVRLRAGLVVNQWSEGTPLTPEQLAAGCQLPLAGAIPIADHLAFNQVHFGQASGSERNWGPAVEALATRAVRALVSEAASA